MHPTTTEAYTVAQHDTHQHNIEQRYTETRLAEVSSIPELRIRDRAPHPDMPLFNIAAVLIGLAFLGSGVGGALGGVAPDHPGPPGRPPDQGTPAPGPSIPRARPRVGPPHRHGAPVPPGISAPRG